MIETSRNSGELRTGGTRAWRNNNPGNIVSGPFAQTNGSTGVAARFAVFADEAGGRAALTTLLQTRTYQALSVGDAINRYAPPAENDTAHYTRIVESRVGVPAATAMSSLTAEQMQNFVGAIGTVEGWRAGTVTPVPLRAAP